MVFGLFNRTPPETQLLIRALEDFKRNYDTPELHDGIVMDEAVICILDTIKTDHAFARSTIGGGGWAATDAAAMLISEWCDAAIMTGQTHIYRGVLNSHGLALLKLYKTCIGHLIANGQLTKDEGVQQVAELLDQIKEMG